MKNKLFELLFRLLPLLAALLSLWLFSFQWQQPDTPSYVAGMEELWHCNGQSPSDRLYRTTKPLALLLPALLGKLPLLEPWQALILQQFLFFLLGLWLFSRVLAFLGLPRREQLLGRGILLSAQVWFFYGLLPLTDTLGWTWALAGLGYLLWARNLSPRQSFFWGLFLGLGLFVKESALLSVLYFAFYLLLFAGSWARRFTLGLAALVGFALPLVFLTSYTWACHDKTLFDWLHFSHSNVADVQQSGLYALCMQGWRSLDLLWFFVFLGIYRAWRQGFGRPWLLLLLTGLSAWLLFPFLWVYHSDRILFMLNLPLLPFAALALRAWPAAPLVLTLAFLLNIGSTYLIYYAEIAGLLWASIGLFLPVFLLFLWRDWQLLLVLDRAEAEKKGKKAGDN